MKFGEQFLAVKIPEWTRKYVDYEALKQLIDSIVLEHLPTDKLNRYKVIVDEYDVSDMSGIRPLSIKGVFLDPVTNELKVFHHRIHANDDDPRVTDSVVIGDLEDPWTVDAEANYRLGRQPTNAPYGNFDPFSELDKIAQTITMCNQIFCKEFVSETEKVNRFYRSQAQLMCGRIGHTLDEAKRIQSMTKVQKVVLQRSFEQSYYALDLLLNYCTMNHVALLKAMKKYVKHTRQVHLKEVAQEYLTGQEFFMDTRGNASCSIARLQTLLKTIYSNVFYKGDMKRGTESLHVKRQDERFVDSYSILIQLALFGGASVVLTVLAVVEYFENYTSLLRLPNDVVNRASYIFSVASVFLLWISLFGVNLLVWDRYCVNYPYILELNPRRRFDAYSVLRSAMAFVLILTTCMFGYVHSASRVIAFPGSEGVVNEDVYPYAFLAVCAIALAVSNIWDSTNFRWFWRRMVCIVLVPLFEVRFGDFFLADQFLSLTTAINELQFAMCIWSQEDTNTLNFCSAQNKWKVPLLVLVPNFWRFIQCLRRFTDQENKENYHPNLTNATKYGIGIFAIFLQFVFTSVSIEYGATSTAAVTCEILWYFFQVADTTSKTIWDFFMDWGLLFKLRKPRQKNVDYPWLRPTRLYPTWTYFAAVIYNVVARYMWIIKYYLVSKYKPGGYSGFVLSTWWGFILFSFLEVVRRFIWCCFRLENEQLNNLEAYRAVTITPPPFQDHNTVELVFEETDKEIDQRLNGLSIQDINSTPDGIMSKDRTKITTFFATLPEEDKVTVLKFLLPDRVWQPVRGSGKSITFSRLHEEDKVRGMIHLFGHMTLEEYCSKNRLTEREPIQTLLTSAPVPEKRKLNRFMIE